MLRHFLPLFLICASGTSGAEPRLSLISKFTPGRFVEPRLVDLDADGDLDIFYGADQVRFADRAWMENLDNVRFSSVQTIGLTQILGSDVLMQLDESPAIEVVNVSLNQDSEEFELQIVDPLNHDPFKEPDRIVIGAAEQVIPVHLDDEFSPQFAIINHDDDSVQLTLKSLKQTTNFEAWSDKLLSFADEGHEKIESIEAMDLDQDGDRDLVVVTEGDRSENRARRYRTFLIERITPSEFSPIPHALDGAFSQLADFDNDGKLELHYRDFAELIEMSGDGFQFVSGSVQNFSDVHPSSHTRIGVHKKIVEVDPYFDGSFIFREAELGDSGETIPTFEQTIPVEEISAHNRQQLRGRDYLLADFDNDGTKDVIVLEERIFYRTEDIGVLVFKRLEDRYEQVIAHEPFHDLRNHIVESMDFDEDGDIDLLIGPDDNGNLGVFENDGVGNFTEAKNRLDLMPEDLDRSTYTISSIIIIDANEDGREDLAMTYQKYPRSFGEPEFQTAHRLLLREGNDFSSPASISEESFRSSLTNEISTMVDWDNDGDLDAIVEGGWIENIDGVLDSTRKDLLQNTTAINFEGNEQRLIGHAVGDVDGDGFPDYVAIGYEAEYDEEQIPMSSKLAVGFNDGTGMIGQISTFEANLVVRDSLGSHHAGPLYLEDLNLDGRADFVIQVWAYDEFGNPYGVSLTLLSSSSISPRDLTVADETTSAQICITGLSKMADFDGDGLYELASAECWTRPTKHGPVFGGGYDFVQSDEYMNPRALADFDGDGDLDSVRASGIFTRTSNRLVLVRNLIIDERSKITADLVEAGISPHLATPEADPDNDGLNNADEYLLGTNPLVPDADLARDLTPRWSPDQKSLTFPRSKDRENHALFYDLQASNDLLFWSRISQANATITDDGPDWELVTVTIPERENTRFFRVSATHDPGR